eukprot:705561_1
MSSLFTHHSICHLVVVLLSTFSAIHSIVVEIVGYELITTNNSGILFGSTETNCKAACEGNVMCNYAVYGQLAGYMSLNDTCLMYTSFDSVIHNSDATIFTFANPSTFGSQLNDSVFDVEINITESIFCGDIIHGTTNHNTPSIYYTFINNLTEPGVYTYVEFSTCNSSYYTTLSLYDSYWSEIARAACDPNPNSSAWWDQAADCLDCNNSFLNMGLNSKDPIYFLQVSGDPYHDLYGAFQLQVDCIPAPSIFCGDIINGTTNHHTQSIYYTFINDLTNAGEAAVWLQFSTCDSSFDTTLYLYDSHWTEIQDCSAHEFTGLHGCRSCGDNASQYRAQLNSWDKLNESIYFLEITGYEDSIYGTFQLQIDCDFEYSFHGPRCNVKNNEYICECLLDECSSTSAVLCLDDMDCHLTCYDCSSIEILWPINGTGSLECNGYSSCWGITFPQPPPYDNYIVECNLQNKCRESFIICPQSADCRLKCIADLACDSVEVVWPIDGAGSIECDGYRACYGINFPKPPSNESYVVECNGSHVCRASHIFCPQNADCRLKCSGPSACDAATIVLPINGTTTIECYGDGAGACNALKPILASDITDISNVNYVVECNDCSKSIVNCPSDASCRVQCVFESSCNLATINWPSEFVKSELICLRHSACQSTTQPPQTYTYHFSETYNMSHQVLEALQITEDFHIAFVMNIDSFTQDSTYSLISIENEEITAFKLWLHTDRDPNLFEIEFD